MGNQRAVLCKNCLQEQENQCSVHGYQYQQKLVGIPSSVFDSSYSGYSGDGGHPDEPGSMTVIALYLIDSISQPRCPTE